MNEDLHWSQKNEFGKKNWQFLFFRSLVCKCPWPITSVIVATITFFYFIVAKTEREISRDYLNRVFNKAQRKKASLWDIYKHFVSFSFSMVEKISYSDESKPLDVIEEMNDDLPKLVEELNQGKGACLVCSHLGNIEILRALAHENQTHASRSFKVIPVMDLSGTAQFNSILKELNPSLMSEIVDANSIGTDTIIWMKEQIQQGNLVVIAGDRTSAHTSHRSIKVPFLGNEAAFPIGSFLLVSLLSSSIYYAFALRKNDLRLFSKCEMHIQKTNLSQNYSRKERDEHLKKMALEYAEILGNLCLKHPYQWYNFYKFWKKN